MIKIGEIIIEQGHFPDGSLFIKAPALNSSLIEWHYENDAELFTLICLRRHFEYMDMDLSLDYVPHARQDRVKKEGDVFTLKYFAEVINSLNFRAVYIFDPHSNVAPALINNVRVVSPIPYIHEVIRQINDPDLVLCYPDEGAMKRYSEGIQYPYTFAVKKRDWSTGQIQSLDLINGGYVQGRSVLIVDDICSKGGTFLYTARALKAAAAGKIYLYVSHCEETLFKGELISSGLLEHIYTTDSIFKPEWENDFISIIRG